MAQNYVMAKKKVFAHRFCAQTLCPSYKRGAMLQVCILFYANYTNPGDPKRGGRGPPGYCLFPNCLFPNGAYKFILFIS